MNRRQVALYFDLADRPLEASWAYELAIQESDANEELFLNLAVIYFQMNDYGFATGYDLHEVLVAEAALRFSEILDAAEKRVGSSVELEFWRLYFDYVHLGSEEFVPRCEALVAQRQSLVPYVYLCSSGKIEHYAESRRLLEQVEGGQTIKERYLRSVLRAQSQEGRKAFS